jgi:beta-ureidopropionase / N-carbamoyl-L-amino-acid hydrolase
MVDVAKLVDVWPASVTFGDELLGRLDAATREQFGVVRRPYGPGEQLAHNLMITAARQLGLAVETDAAGNLLMTLEGADKSLPRLLAGSHLDSVPAGGNFDGAAGVVAGLVAVHALRAGGITPRAGLTVIATRAEEGSSWFKGQHKSHFGSRAALGQLDRTEMARARTLEGDQSLFDVMVGAGFSPEQIDFSEPLLDRSAYRGFVEIHIEQGPILVEKDLPVGVVTGIRGNLRLRNARVIGDEAHSGAVPAEYRRDALLAAVELVAAVEAQWQRWLEAGRDVVCTFGRFGTVPERHSLTKVPGEVRFSLDIRSEEAALLDEAAAFVQAEADRIGSARSVGFILGPFDRAPPALMTPALVEQLIEHAETLGIPFCRLASGGGHDSANFVAAKWPTAMIFVRNPNGSHNPDEAMAIEDFAFGVRLLTALVLDA